MRPVTKDAVSIIDPDAVPTVLRNAFKLAQAERPGAVHIELPEDVAESRTDARVQKPGLVRRPAPDPKAIMRAAELINQSKNPLVILSSGANRNLISRELTQFIAKTGIYAVHTQMGKGVLSDESDHSLFAAGIHKRDYVNCGIDMADLIMTIGYNIVEYPPYVWNRDLNKTIINIDFTEAEVDQYYNPDIEVIGDISCALRRIGALVTERKNGEAFRSVRQFLDKKLSLEFKKRFPPTPGEVVAGVREVLAHDDIVTLDNGIYKLWFSRLYRTYRPNTFILDNALATMGAGLPAGITAAMLRPDRNVLAVVGDGGFMMNSRELETAVRCGVALVVLLLNDNAFGFIKWEQEAKGFGNFGLEYANPDFVKYAESYGAVGMRVGAGDSLPALLRKAFSLKKTVLIECPIDYSVNYEMFTKELANIVCNS
jgi:acetolactate synthase-1/2/3 large subunit